MSIFGKNETTEPQKYSELVEINQARTVKLIHNVGGVSIHEYLVLVLVGEEWIHVSSRPDWVSGFRAYLARLEMIGDTSYATNSQWRDYYPKSQKQE